MASPHPVDDKQVFSDVRDTSRDGSDKDLEQPPAGPSGDDAVDTRFQAGVQDIEAVTISWSKTSLIIAYVFIWLVYFIQGLVSGVSGTLAPYVTSNFALHSLTSTTGVMSAVIGGVTNLSIAKTLDVFGRPQGFLLCVVLATLGLIMSAACNGVELYAASQVFYAVGINGIGYSMSVFIADITSLRHRGLVQSLCASPTIVTAWMGGPISTAFLNGAGWRWAFGMESILVPVVTVPLFLMFMKHLSAAKKKGLVPKRSSGRTFFESARYYAREFDVIGLLSLSVGVAFFLLPFNLYAFQAKGFGSAMLICFLVFGILLLIFFGVWEAYFAKISFVPWTMMKDRTVQGACILAFALFFATMCWNMFMSSILQVVNNLSVTNASYVMAINSVVGFAFAIGSGALMSWKGLFKPVTLYAAMPLFILGHGLMIHFNEPNGRVGYIVMCMIFIAIGSGVMMLTDEIAILAAVKDQQYFAIAIALVSMFANMGSAVGLTVSSAIWNDIMPKKLLEFLPEEDLPNIMMISMDIVTQLSYPVGSPTRTAIQRAYGEAQKYLFTAATASLVLGVVGILMWQNINIIGIKQTKGNVF